MATPTYDLINSTVLASSAASVTFTGITQNYRDLIMRLEMTDSSALTALINFNGDSSSTYETVTMRGSGSTTASQALSQTRVYTSVAVTYLDGTGTLTMQCLDYSATDKHKSGLIRQDLVYSSGGNTLAAAFRYPSTSAITSIEITSGQGNLPAGTNVYLYGIAG